MSSATIFNLQWFDAVEHLEIDQHDQYELPLIWAKETNYKKKWQIKKMKEKEEEETSFMTIDRGLEDCVLHIHVDIYIYI